MIAFPVPGGGIGGGEIPVPPLNPVAGSAGGTISGLIGSGQITPNPKAHTATAQSAHDMLKAIGIELAFVVVATMLAGMSGSWGNGILTLMLALLVLRGLFEIDLFAAFAQGTVLHPS